MRARRNPGRSPRGALTILAMFALGGAVLWGLFQARRASPPRSPDVPWGVPQGAVKFVSFDCRGAGPDQHAPALDSIRESDPDFVMLQRVPAPDVLRFVEALRLQQTYYTNLFQRTGPRGRDETGSLVLSKHPLYDARPVEPEGRRGPHLGTWAVAAIGGVRFVVVSVAPGAGGVNPVAGAWGAAGSPPVVAGVRSAQAEPPGQAPPQWQRVSEDGSIVADGRWFVVERSSGAGFAAVTLSGTPPPVTVGVPDRMLRFAAYNVYHDYRGIEGTTGEVGKLDPPPDFVLLSEMSGSRTRAAGTSRPIVPSR